MRRFVFFLAILAVVCTPMQAKDKQGKGKGKHKSAPPAVAFVAEDRALIMAYLRGGPSGLPPGLAKRGGDLPPGLEKQIRRKGQLPPGLQRQVVPFPAELVARLRPLPPGYERGFVGHFALILDRVRVVVDVMKLE